MTDEVLKQVIKTVQRETIEWAAKELCPACYWGFDRKQVNVLRYTHDATEEEILARGLSPVHWGHGFRNHPCEASVFLRGPDVPMASPEELTQLFNLFDTWKKEVTDEEV